ncbi:MAG: periplasmic heavy metal sensor [Burkholderiaceae bacterium]|nr:periplasmic heavy metal sensor [Burkholderiaceae bacterium]
MNRSTMWKGLLALSLALNLGTIAAVLVQQARPAHNAAAPLNVPDYLGLGPQQRERWQQLEPAFLRDLAANWSDIRRHRESLVRHIFAEPPQRAAIDAEQATIAALQAAQQQRVIAQLLAERDLLDAAQREKLMNLLLSRYAQESTEEEQLHRH